MKANVGTIDRVLRIIVGIILLSLIFVGPQTLWGLIGIIPLFTGIFRYCPAYPLLKMDTLSKNENK